MFSNYTQITTSSHHCITSILYRSYLTYLSVLSSYQSIASNQSIFSSIFWHFSGSYEKVLCLCFGFYFIFLLLAFLFHFQRKALFSWHISFFTRCLSSNTKNSCFCSKCWAYVIVTKHVWVFHCSYLFWCWAAANNIYCW